MVLDLFKNLSDKGELVVIESGIPLREQLEGLDWSQLVILANGKKVSPDYAPTAEDYLVIRRIPGAEPATWVAIIAVVAAAVAGVVAGVNAYKVKKQQAKLKELQESLSARDDVSNVPWLQGASNALATGKTQPYIIGEHLFTPYLLQTGFYKLDGDDGVNQDYYVVLEGGFSSQAIQSISADESTIHDFGTVTSAQTGQTRPTSGIWAYNSSYNDNLIQIGQAGTGITLDEFLYKRTVDTPNVQLPWREDCETWTATREVEYTQKVWVERGDDNGYYRTVTYTTTETYTAGEVTTETKKFTLDKHAMDVEICIMFNGLCKYNSEGKKKSHTRNIGFRYSTDGGSTWSAMSVTGDGVTSYSTSGTYYVATFTKNTTSQIRYALTHTFTTAEALAAETNDLPIVVEVTNRDTQSTSTGGAYEDCYVQWIQSQIYDPDESDSTGLTACKIIEDRENEVSTVIGLKLRASDENQDKLGKINIITSGVARTWDGSAWTTAKTATSNPASWILEVLTSDTHPASQFDDSEIDLDSLGALYEFCETEGFNVDMVLTAGQKKEQILEAICATCRCMLYRDIYGLISVAIDEEKENASVLLNAQNIQSIEITKSMARPVDGLKLSWVNAEAGYVQDEYVCMRSGVTRTSDSIIREMEVTGITDYDHLMKYGRYLMAGERLRPKTIKVVTGREGVYYTPFSKVLMQDDSLRVGLGNAVIKKVVTSDDYIIALQLEEYVDLDTTNDFGVIIQCVSDSYCTPLSCAIEQGGRTDEIELTTPISVEASVIPHAGDILSYGYIVDGAFDTITSEYLITGIEPGDDTVTLELIDYDEDVYTTGDYDEYIPNITRKVAPYEPVIVAPASTASDVEEVLSGDNIDDPDTPADVTCVATEAGLVCTVSPPDTSYLNNSIAYISWEYDPEGIQDGSSTDEPSFTVLAETSDYEITIPWPTGTYPEADDLYYWLVRCKFVSTYGKESEYSTYTTVDTDSYGTWIVQDPDITLRTSKRSLHLHMEQPSSVDVYGNVHYQVQISRYDDLDTDGETRLWYQPDLSTDPYSSESAYKSTQDGYVVATSDFSITVPLEGQDSDPPNPTDTVYYFRVTPYNEAGSGDATVTDQMTARATSARDVVLAHTGTGDMNTYALTAENIYTENLASIVGMFAQIVDGAETSDNFWDLENSEFRVGNDHSLEGDTIDQDDSSAQYIHYVDGDLKMHITQLIADISSSYVKGVFDIYSTDTLTRCRVSETGITLQKRDDTSSSWETKGVMTVGSNGSLMITNTAPSSDYTIAKPSGAYVYHFSESTGTDPLDDNSANGESLTFGTYIYADTSPIMDDLAQYYQGTLSKEGLTVKGSETYGTAAFRSADSETYDGAYGYYASRISYASNVVTLHILDTLTDTETTTAIAVSDSWSAFDTTRCRSFWYNGSCFVGLVYTRSESPTKRFALYNSAGTCIYLDTLTMTEWNQNAGIVSVYDIAADLTSWSRNSFTISSATTSTDNTVTVSASVYEYVVPFGSPFYFISTTSGTVVYMFENTGNTSSYYRAVASSDLATYVGDKYCAWVKTTLNTTYYSGTYYFGGSTSYKTYIGEIDTSTYSYAYDSTSTSTVSLNINCIRISDGQLGTWAAGSGTFTEADGSTAYDGSHEWVLTDDMLFDLTDGSAYRVTAYAQTSSETKYYSFWYKGDSIRLGSCTIETDSDQWLYCLITLADSTVSWTIYNQSLDASGDPVTYSSGSYDLTSNYTDSDTADNLDFILSGSVEEFMYGALPSNSALMVEYKVPYDSTTNLPISDQFILTASDISKASGNVLAPPENNLSGTSETGDIGWYNTNQIVASGAVVTLGSGDMPGRKVHFTTLGACTISYTAIDGTTVTDSVNAYLSLEYTWTGSAWFCSSAPPIGRVVEQKPDEDEPSALYGGQWELHNYGGVFFRSAGGDSCGFHAPYSGAFTSSTVFVSTDSLVDGNGTSITASGYIVVIGDSYYTISSISGSTITLSSAVSGYANITEVIIVQREGAPNITFQGLFNGAGGTKTVTNGACRYAANSITSAGGTGITYGGIDFDASRSNSGYGRHSHFIPHTAALRYWLRLQ